MTVLCNLAGGSLHSLQAWALARLFPFELPSADPRAALLQLLGLLLTTAANALFQTIARRAVRGARFTTAATAADTMVAAGRR